MRQKYFQVPEMSSPGGQKEGGGTDPAVRESSFSLPDSCSEGISPVEQSSVPKDEIPKALP
jgi:hypothetical protein